MAIPLKQLLPDREVAPGDRIHANFMRSRRFDGKASWSWSPIFAEGYRESLHRMGQIYIAPLAREGLLPVNGGFKSTSGDLPDGWVHNKSKDYEPHGKVALDSGRLRISSSGNRVHLYNQEILPVRRGDRVVLEFVARAKGTGAAGAYFYGGKGDGAGSCFKSVTVADKLQEYRIVLPVTNTRPSRFTNGFRPVLAATPDSQVEYSQLKVHVIPRGEQR